MCHVVKTKGGKFKVSGIKEKGMSKGKATKQLRAIMMNKKK